MALEKKNSIDQYAFDMIENLIKEELWESAFNFLIEGFLNENYLFLF